MATVEKILMAKGPNVIVASKATTVREAVNLMCEANVGSIIVKDDEVTEGIFTERDLLRRVVSPGHCPDTTPLGQVMTSPVRSVKLSTTISECKNIFAQEHIRHLAIIEQNSLLGVIGLRDVLAIKLEEDEKIINKIVEQMDDVK